jgi:UDP-3-O-[3-hydroxymyristoyl] glucosamine N-acyltransferase
MEFTAKQIAEYLHGSVEGNENAAVHTFAKIEEAAEGSLTFLANPAYEHFIYTTKASIVLTNKDFKPREAVSATLVRVDNAYECIASLLTLYEQSKPKKKGISSLASISSTATIGKDCYIEPFAVVGDKAVIGDNTTIMAHSTIGDNATVGSNCLLYPNVTVYHDCKIGNRVTLHAGVVIGADGFGFAPTPEGYEKIPQIGIVTIEDDVEIGANACVDRSTMGTTLVKKGVKLDNMVQIAHNVVVGENTVMSAQVGVAGSTKIGQWCMFGGQVGIAGHATIADNTHSGAQAGIAGSIIKPGRTVIGSPAIDARRFAKSNAVFRNLPQLSYDVEALKQEIEELKKQLHK